MKMIYECVKCGFRKELSPQANVITLSCPAAVGTGKILATCGGTMKQFGVGGLEDPWPKQQNTFKDIREARDALTKFLQLMGEE